MTVTGEKIVFMISQAQTRAKSCWTRPLLLKTEVGRDNRPITTVYSQIKGAKTKYERSRLSSRYFPVGAGLASAGVERSSAIRLAREVCLSISEVSKGTRV